MLLLKRPQVELPGLMQCVPTAGECGVCSRCQHASPTWVETGLAQDSPRSRVLRAWRPSYWASVCSSRWERGGLLQAAVPRATCLCGLVSSRSCRAESGHSLCGDPRYGHSLIQTTGVSQPSWGAGHPKPAYTCPLGPTHPTDSHSARSAGCPFVTPSLCAPACSGLEVSTPFPGWRGPQSCWSVTRPTGRGAGLAVLTTETDPNQRERV